MVKVNEKCKEHDMNDLYCHLIVGVYSVHVNLGVNMPNNS